MITSIAPTLAPPADHTGALVFAVICLAVVVTASVWALLRPDHVCVVCETFQVDRCGDMCEDCLRSAGILSTDPAAAREAARRQLRHHRRDGARVGYQGGGGYPGGRPVGEVGPPPRVPSASIRQRQTGRASR